ncbi:hypothetical protein ED312_13690 [Sinomicrobium pectinilyticum]|uniref:Uncharacterized protein n=1 Tax=Sinomicrobium pectinilyticum TaxID=1084421 RepID=A0A3N0E9G6_SINP1|nr:hypothetical protein [Sinomicrobium pectinilyticum]RNL84478.1 hypothetical protein ED312_13690 [Sinomicrobium pectinilyticum]
MLICKRDFEVPKRRRGQLTSILRSLILNHSEKLTDIKTRLMAKGELDLKYKFAEFVRTQRKKKGYSQSELAIRALGSDVKQNMSETFQVNKQINPCKSGVYLLVM